jgi:hypothetical protein
MPIKSSMEDIKSGTVGINTIMECITSAHLPSRHQLYPYRGQPIGRGEQQMLAQDGRAVRGGGLSKG